MNAISIDPSLVEEVRKFGAFDVGACLNCGSCSVECALARGSTTFPRRTMRLALFGMAASLKASLEPWLCHYCGECSAACPRQAEPAEAMMTLRKYLISRYDLTGLASRLNTSAAWRVGANLLAAALVLILVLFYHFSVIGLAPDAFVSADMVGAVGLQHAVGPIGYAFTIAVFAIPALLLAFGAVSMTRSALAESEIRVPFTAYLAALPALFTQGLAQNRIPGGKDRLGWLRHFALFSGFVIMSVLTLFFLRWFQTDAILPLWHPQRWLGYLATLGLLYGSLAALIGRAARSEEIHRHSDLGDWILPTLILLVALTGIAIHILRYVGLQVPSHFAFFAHMVFVTPMLLVEVPFGKLSHLVYRPLALYLQAAREKALAAMPAAEVANHA